MKLGSKLQGAFGPGINLYAVRHHREVEVEELHVEGGSGPTVEVGNLTQITLAPLPSLEGAMRCP